jgi:hypothetical protein
MALTLERRDETGVAAVTLVEPCQSRPSALSQYHSLLHWFGGGAGIANVLAGSTPGSSVIPH